MDARLRVAEECEGDRDRDLERDLSLLDEIVLRERSEAHDDSGDRDLDIFVAPTVINFIQTGDV